VEIDNSSHCLIIIYLSSLIRASYFIKTTTHWLKIPDGLAVGTGRKTIIIFTVKKHPNNALYAESS